MRNSKRNSLLLNCRTNSIRFERTFLDALVLVQVFYVLVQVFYVLCVGGHENSQIVSNGAIGSSIHGIGGNPKLKGAIPSAPSSPKFEDVSTIGTTKSPID